MASDPTVDFPEPKTVGDILERMGTDNAPQDSAQVNIPTVWGLAPLKLGVYQAMSMVMAELGEMGIAKEREASQGGKFKFRGIDQVYAALNSLLVKHNLLILPRYTDRWVEERKTSGGNAIFNVTVRGEFTFLCTTDGSKTAEPVIMYGEAFDVADKATSKAQSISYKYAAFQVFCIPVDGENTDDPDATQNTTIAPKGSAQQQPQESDEDRRKRMETEARNNYNDAEAWLRACTNVADLKKTFEESIRWDRIPKGWHPRLVAVEKEMLAQINAATAAPKRGSVAPKFELDGDIDIPF